jgi:spore coat protein A
MNIMTGLTPFIDVLPIPTTRKPLAQITVHMNLTPNAQLHSELPPTPQWTYEHTLPGPTIEVRKGQTLQAIWKNKIPAAATLPLKVVEVPYDGVATTSIPQNQPGTDGQGATP